METNTNKALFSGIYILKNATKHAKIKSAIKTFQMKAFFGNKLPTDKHVQNIPSSNRSSVKIELFSSSR